MSNRRRPRSGYAAYLRSDAWHTRRRHWFAEEERRTGRPAECAVCWNRRHLELHHLEYRGITSTAAVWLAGEAHEDLVALCTRDHEAVHRKLDADEGYAHHLDRREASLRIIGHLRATLYTRLMAATT